jgi:hypothetical protein
MKKIALNCGKLFLGLAILLVSSTVVAEGAASYVRPDTDISKYSKFMIRTLNMDNIEVLKPVWEDDPEKWSFNPENRAAVQAKFMKIMTKELEKDGGYPVVTERGEDVILLEVELLSITPYVKPGTEGTGGGFEISTLGSGEVVVSAEFRDSVTRELLILVEGERVIGTEYKELSRENHEANVRELFTTWGKNVRAKMDEAHSK